MGGNCNKAEMNWKRPRLGKGGKKNVNTQEKTSSTSGKTNNNNDDIKGLTR